VRDQFKISGMWFFSGRQTFVIGLDGKVAFQYSAMLEGKAHADQALQYIKSAKK
jgi:peroxiredoxin Q/BCP